MDYQNLLTGLLGVIGSPQHRHLACFERSKRRLLDWATVWNGEEGYDDILESLELLERPLPDVDPKHYTRIRNDIIQKLKEVPPPFQLKKAPRRHPHLPSASTSGSEWQREWQRRETERNPLKDTYPKPNGFFLNGHLGVIDNPQYKGTAVAERSKKILLKIAERRGGVDEVEEISRQLEVLKIPDQSKSAYTATRNVIVRRLAHE